MELREAVLLLEAYLRNDLSNMTAEERLALQFLISFTDIVLRLLKVVSK